MMKQMAVLGAAIAAALSGATATAGPCPSETVGDDALIDRSEKIVIVRLAPMADADGEAPEQPAPALNLEAERKKARQADAQKERIVTPFSLLRFEVVEYVKGEGDAQLYLAGVVDADKETTLDENCRVTARFHPEKTYLVFMGAPHVKAYQSIAGDDDPWLSYVRRRVSRD